jgi:hypothetical protein
MGAWSRVLADEIFALSTERRARHCGLFVSLWRCGVESKRDRIGWGMNDEPETKSLKLLCDMCNELSRAVNSLGDKVAQSLFDNFNFHSAKFINQAAEGFIFLRQATPPRIAASKLLIRPVLEIKFRLEAIQKQPELLFRIAYRESEEDRKWTASIAAIAGKEDNYYRATHEQHWKDFKAKYAEQFPNHELVERTITTAQLAAAADLAYYYDTHYRMYCRYTHAALQAIGGSLDRLSNSEDNRTIAVCTLTALRALAPIGADVPKLDLLADRLNKLEHLLISRDGEHPQ